MQAPVYEEPKPQAAPQMQTAPQAPAASAQPPVLVWDPASGQYVPQQAPAQPAQQAKPNFFQQAKETVANAVSAVTGGNASDGKKKEKSYAQQLIDSFAKSATTSAGRETGRQLSRNLLGIFGLTSNRKRK